MKRKAFDAAQALREIEDRLVPRLSLSPTERAVYYHLLRHTWVEGSRRVLVSVRQLSAGTRLSYTSVRTYLWQLAEKGALRVVERGARGHVVELLLPDGIRECRAAEERTAARPADPESADFYGDDRLRPAIHRREKGRCFYCRRKVQGLRRVLDHVVPRRLGRRRKGENSYRNVALCCAACNLRKSNRPAAQWLRELLREGRLDAAEFRGRLRALRRLARGELKPVFRARLDGRLWAV
jgi:5-methylcytosine-specific restriction endonuclease McrA